MKQRIRSAGVWIAMSLVLTGCNSKTELIAHRGASYLAPENTVASAKLAWDKKADAVEVDIYRAQDGKVVVIHDKTTKRTGGEELEVATSTAEQLRQLDVGSFKSQTYAGERIPLLEEIIATLPPQRRLFVEIKCGPEVLWPLQTVIDASGKRDQIVIIGFGLDTVKASKKLMPDLPTYWLVGTKKDEETEAWIPHSATLIDDITGTGLDGLNVHWAGVTKDFAQDVRDAGLGLYVWTVNDPVEAARLAKLGVAGITTDRPGWLRSQLGGAAGPVRWVQASLRGQPAEESGK
ncbi:MAG: glycerophosphodiester phosphodiesterase [Phycisphaerales bacterium]|nr:MAG: glycerophosphodiester phosphodiesterase [Phycisphaerales bacterium]